jgi:hypothetical protein
VSSIKRGHWNIPCPELPGFFGTIIPSILQKYSNYSKVKPKKLYRKMSRSRIQIHETTSNGIYNEEFY